MTGDHLHQYDLELCDYMVGNVAQHMDCLAFNADLETVLTSRLLLDYLKQAQCDALDMDEKRLLLNDDELYRLELTFEGDLNRLWVPSEPVHRRYHETLPEVRDNLSRQTAEEWSEVCAKFARQLEDRHTRLSKGIEVIRDWVGRLRTLLRVMGAPYLLPQPEGLEPTPTHLKATKVKSVWPRSKESFSAERPEGPNRATEDLSGLADTLGQLADAVSRISTPSAPSGLSPGALCKEDAAVFLGVSVPTIEYLIRTRKLAYVQCGAQRGRVIPVDGLRRFLEDHRRMTGEELRRKRKPR